MVKEDQERIELLKQKDNLIRMDMEMAMKDGTIRTPEMIMKERIRLRITPRIVYECFHEALKRYEEKRRNHDASGED